MNETLKKPIDRRALACYIALLLAPACAAGLAAWYFAPAAALGDPFSAAVSTWDLILAAAHLLLPILCEFLAVFVFAFSPLTLFVSLCALCERAVRVSLAIRALPSFGAGHTAAVCAYAIGALLLALFCAAAAVLSPKLRTIRFSSFEGRREALCLSVWFFTLSGAASLFMLGAGALLHFA